jgi:hypothetical protein
VPAAEAGSVDRTTPLRAIKGTLTAATTRDMPFTLLL